MGYESFFRACGWVAVGSNIMPKEFALLFHCLIMIKFKEAELYRQILPIIRLVGGHRYVSATKAALMEIGQSVGLPRSPRLPLPDSEMFMVRDALEMSRIKMV